MVKSFLRIIFQLFLESILFVSYPLLGLLNFVVKDKISHSKVSGGKTIIIVERWLHKNWFHVLWKRYLERRGFQVYLIFHPLGKGTFTQSAAKLSRFIEKNDLKDVTLVGVSSGGLTCIVYLQQMNGWNRVTNFISVGVPFKGTRMALALIRNESCRELLPWNSFIRDLSSQELHHKEKIVCIISKFDELIPRKSGYLSGTHKKVINVYGHNYLHLLCEQTYSTIATYAQKG